MQTFVAKDYQQMLINHMINIQRAGCYSGMGTGKTSSTLTAIDALKIGGEVEHPLIVAPLRVAKNVWPSEAQKWEHLAHLNVIPITGNVEQRYRALKTKADIHTINYENLPWLREAVGQNWPFDMVVSDECSKLKSFRGSIQESAKGTKFIRVDSGTRARALAKVAHNRKYIRRWVNLTGTPCANGLADLWGHQWFIDGGYRLGRTFGDFTRRWFKESYDGYSIEPLPHAFDEITALLSDVCLSIEARDYMDLPELVNNTVYVDLPSQALKVYRDMTKELFTLLENRGIEAVNAADKSGKLLQIASGALYHNGKSGDWAKIHDEKIDALHSIIEEANGMPVLVAYHWKHDLERLKKAFPKGKELDQGPRTIDAWNAGKIPLLFVHPASAGHGLNLAQGGNILAFFSNWWNLEERLQVIERIGPTRQAQLGEKRPCFVHSIVARGTVDELVLMRHETKRSVQDLLMTELRRL